MQRRQFFVLMPAALAATAGAGPARAQASELKESDPEAVALDYVADARRVDRQRQPKYQPGQTCANCGLFVAPPGGAAASRLGGCQLFYGKEVTAIGWCSAWEAKPQ